MGYATEAENQIELFSAPSSPNKMAPVYRIKLVRDEGSGYGQRAVSGASAVYEFLKEHGLPDEAQEVLVCLFMDTRNVITGMVEVTRGTLSASLFHPREVLKGALLANAKGIIIAHNHPSGDPSPSSADRQVTEILAAAAKLMQIDLLDHVVIGAERWYSFRDHNAL